MSDIAKSIFGAPVSTLLILAGIIFLLIGVVGNISGKIEPGPKGRFISGVIGFICMVIGIWLQPGLTTSSGSNVSTAVEQSEPRHLVTPPSPPQSNGTDAPKTPALGEQVPPAAGPANPTDNSTEVAKAPIAKAKYGRFEGRAINEEGAALRVEIKIANETVRSDEDLGGDYVFPKVAPGVYNVTVKREPYDSRYRSNHKGAHIRPQIIYRVPIHAGKRTWLNIVTSEGEDLQEIATPQFKIDDAMQGGPMPK